MTAFNWAITNMSSYPQAEGQVDVVFSVEWNCTGIDGQQPGAYTATTTGSVPVTYTAGSPYTPYADLTQEQVWGWIDPSIDRPEVEANLQAMIDAQKNPPVVTPPLPWAQGA